MAFKIPSTLKLTQLKVLALKCGISSSGTKTALTQRLQHEVSALADVPLPKRSRVLSIDMGIRNLAYCSLDVPVELLGATSGVKERQELPKLDSWHRIAVSSPMSRANSKDLWGKDEEDIPQVAKESFSPATLSMSAYRLLRDTLLPHNPTHVLVERQRFRSMGSKHILEWTVRVNMFESMIYAILCALKEEGVWHGEVVGVLPGKVGPFWIGDSDESSIAHSKVRNTSSAKIRNKGLKIDLVRSWLQAGKIVGLGNQDVEEMARRYMSKWDRLPGGVKGMKKGQHVEEMGKLDDLADCLLQGMAWIRWEQSKRLALEQGVEALLEG